jgi:hypothetical protein
MEPRALFGAEKERMAARWLLPAEGGHGDKRGGDRTRSARLGMRFP